MAWLDDDAAGGEIRSGRHLDQLVDVRTRVLDQMQERVAQLLHIVRRDAGCHAHGNARGAVGEQVGEVGRKDGRFLIGAVIGGAEIDRLLIDALKQQTGDRAEAAFRVPHGRRVIPVHVAEIALPVDERVADRKVLCETDERIVDRLIAVGVEVAHDLTDDLGALLVAAGGIELELPHGEEDAPVHGLEAVAHVGEGPVHDGGEGIGEVALLQSIFELDGLDGGRRGGRENRRLGHGRWLLAGEADLKCPGAALARVWYAAYLCLLKCSTIYRSPCRHRLLRPAARYRLNGAHVRVGAPGQWSPARGTAPSPGRTRVARRMPWPPWRYLQGAGLQKA